jgi:hypothetical protein
LVAAALDVYFGLHAQIFGNYTGRLPPEPKSEAQLAMLNNTFQPWVVANGLAVLQPLFYSFFTLQGMGSVVEMPAYYGLLWCNPTSMREGGFGNDNDAPVAMVKEGFGAIMDAIVANEPSIELHCNTAITSVTRFGTGARVDYVDPASGAAAARTCDIVALTGNIADLVRDSHPPSSDSVDGSIARCVQDGAECNPNGSSGASCCPPLSCLPFSASCGTGNTTARGPAASTAAEAGFSDAKARAGTGGWVANGANKQRAVVPAVVTDPTPAEQDLFGSKQSMQFLISLIDFGSPPPGFRAVEYWPDSYDIPGAVILRRDVGYVETGYGHAVGGLQSMSIRNDTSMAVHWQNQQAWMVS